MLVLCRLYVKEYKSVDRSTDLEIKFHGFFNGVGGGFIYFWLTDVAV